MLTSLETPALLLDLSMMERNLARMAVFFEGRPARLRPHYKNHKCPMLAHRQLAAGAIGITCATLREADALIRHGITNILIANEIAGALKIRHFVELTRRADVILAIDNPETVCELAAAAKAQRVIPNVVVDIDVGQGRCGVQPGEPALALARQAIESGLGFRGLMGHEGHAGRLQPGPDKERVVCRAMEKLTASSSLIRANGIAVEIVSAGKTGTYSLSGRYPGVTEIQAGSYLVMDTGYQTVCPDFDLALSVLTTVISRTGNERIIVDAGLKSISAERGMPTLRCPGGARLRKLNAEHGTIDILDPGLPVAVGDQIEIWAHYSDGTINLHERMYGVRNGCVEEILPLEG